MIYHSQVQELEIVPVYFMECYKVLLMQLK